MYELIYPSNLFYYYYFIIFFTMRPSSCENESLKVEKCGAPAWPE